MISRQVSSVSTQKEVLVHKLCEGTLKQVGNCYVCEKCKDVVLAHQTEWAGYVFV